MPPMPPRPPSRPFLRRQLTTRTASSPRPPCLLCSLAQAPSARKPWRPRSAAVRRRANATAAASAAIRTSESPAKKYTTNPREELEKALFDLQKDAAPYVNISRIQLALRNLRQDPGEESIRIAILALSGQDGGVGASQAAKKLLKVLVADPLSPETDWERDIDGHDLSKPMVARIGRKEDAGKNLGEVEFQRPRQHDALLREVHVDSPEFNGHGIEVLVMEGSTVQGLSAKEFEEQALVPTVDIQSAETRYSPVATPVHKTLYVGEGLMGAAGVAMLPVHGENVLGVANIPGYRPDEKTKGITPFAIVDLPVAEKGIEVFRTSLSKAMEYERLWFESNIPAVSTWLKKGILTTDDGSTKPPVITLISSILRHAEASIQVELGRRNPTRKTGARSATSIRLEQGLAEWAEKAHRELQESLDAAFKGSRWRKLGWWRLFWRVDDVSMFAGEVLGQHFLSDAERNIIYLAGRIKEAGVFEGKPEGYIAPKPFTGEVRPAEAGKETEVKNAVPEDTPRYTTSPSNIAHTRSYLSVRTVPALQALAQRLVLQTASTIGTTSALGGLMFLSNFSIEASGAVAALGAVWSLQRMQRQWEKARSFWEGEVREEGRKAVKSVEASVAEALDRGARRQSRITSEGRGEIDKSRAAVERAKAILALLK